MLSYLPLRESPVIATMGGIECKALLDAWSYVGSDGQIVIADIKTTDDSCPEAFARKVANYHYDMQARWYCDILQAEREPLFFWIAVEKTAPFAVAVYDASDWMESGRRKCERALALYAECMASGEWPCPSEDIELLIRPQWAK